MERFYDKDLVEKVLRKKCYYGKVYGFDLIFDSIKRNKFEKKTLNNHLEFEIKDNFKVCSDNY